MKLTQVITVNITESCETCHSSIYSISTHFFEKYVKIKIEDHKILVLMGKHSRIYVLF